MIAVYPVNDDFNHDLFNESCWCNPRIEENGQLIVHNSFDGREDFEEVEDIQ